jgi:fibronectin type 3 domain-containing protein
MKNALFILKFALTAALLAVLTSCGYGRSLSGVFQPQSARNATGPAAFDDSLGIKLASDSAGQMVLFCLDDHGKPDASLNKYFAPGIGAGGLTVAIDAKNAVGMNHAFFDLKYDASRVTPARVDFGTFLGQPSQVLSMSLTKFSGHVPFGIARIGDAGSGVSGGGLIATVTLKPGAFAGGTKAVSVAPYGAGGTLTDLTRYVDSDTNFTSFTFTEVNVGDYNADGEANIADLQPMALHYGHRTNVNTDPDVPALSTPYMFVDVKPADRQIDGNGDGEIGITDLQPLANNYSSSIIGYDVRVNSIRVVDPANPTGPSVSRIAPPTMERERYQVMPIYRVATAGSNPIATVDVNPVSAEGTEGVDSRLGCTVTASTLRGKPPLVVHLAVSNTFGGTQPYSYSWAYGDGTPIGTGPTADLSLTSAGFYDVSLVVSDSASHSIKRRIPRIFVDSLIPDPPGGLTGQRGTDAHSVALSWPALPPTPALLGYNVYYSRIPGDLTPLRANQNLIPSGSTAFMVTGLQTSQKYFFRITQEVTGASGNVESGLGGEIFVITGNPSATAPSKPTGLTAIPGDRQVYLSWNANPEADIAHYDVFYSQTQNDPDPTRYGSTTQTNDLVSGLTNDITYYFKIKAVNNSLLSSVFSDEVSAAPSATPTLPAKILNLLATTNDPDKIALTWDADANATSYHVLRGTTQGGPYPDDIATVNAPAHNYDDTSAVAGTQYYYVVYGANPFGQGPNSDEAAGRRVPLSELQPDKITGLTATTGDLTGVSLVWNPDAKATQYKLYRSTNPADTNPGLVTTLSGTAFLDTPPDLLRDFYYWVSGTNTWGEGPKSDSAKGNQGMAAPTGVFASQGTFNTKVYVFWNAMSNVTGYKVYRSTVSGGPTPTEVGDVTTSYFNDFGALAEVDYYYTVRAYNAYGTGDASTEAMGYRKAGPMNGGAWPKYQGDLHNTGFVLFPTPVNILAMNWQANLAADATPVVDDQHRVYVGDNAAILRQFDSSGNLLWAAPTDGSVISGAAAIGGDYTAYVGTMAGNLYAIKPDGTPKWANPVGLPGRIDGGVAIDNDGNLYVTCDVPGGTQMFKISPREGIGVLFPFPVGQSASTPAIDTASGTVYCADKNGFVFGFTTQGASLWPPFATGAAINGSVSISPDGTLIAVANSAGNVFCLQAGTGVPAPGWPLNGVPLGMAIDATPAWGVFGGQTYLYVVTNPGGGPPPPPPPNAFGLYCINAANAQQVWMAQLAPPILAAYAPVAISQASSVVYLKTTTHLLQFDPLTGAQIGAAMAGIANLYSGMALDSNTLLYLTVGASLVSVKQGP